ncbi:MAG: cryptochrome/photolyase family protein [Betaproteobacteria bacterium]|nr:cryptochrome/photolyase family protein [Betaproteobacteria bacterium]
MPRRAPSLPSAPTTLRHLVLVLGDQLDAASSALDGFDPACDRVVMIEAMEESTHIPSSKQRIAVFLSAMRHFAAELRERGWPVDYHALDHTHGPLASLAQGLTGLMARHRPRAVVLAEPGDWRVDQSLREACARENVPIEVRVDRHFLCTRETFERHAAGRKQLRLEYFYREMRRRHDVLMVDDASSADGRGPAGGQWNFDADNRESFGAEGPGALPSPRRFAPDAITREVIALVESRFASHPGHLSDFGWPVSRAQALEALDDFIAHRLIGFGRWQDAIWAGEAFLYHSLLSVALNLKLLNPREVIIAAEKAWREGQAELAAVEGFIRQILGWREYVRGLYWLKMPAYLEWNALEAHEALPEFYWTGNTPMACLADAVGQTLRFGYAHHIQRLMVTGLYALLLGVEPRQVHQWYLSVYVDAVEWVELPNTLGMSQFADGGLMASKPYVATGKYIERMSNHCGTCRFRPGERIGERACPFTTLYWDFLSRHQAKLAGNPRMALQVKNLARVSVDDMRLIRERAQWIRAGGLSETQDA